RAPGGRAPRRRRAGGSAQSAPAPLPTPSAAHRASRRSRGSPRPPRSPGTATRCALWGPSETNGEDVARSPAHGQFPFGASAGGGVRPLLGGVHIAGYPRAMRLPSPLLCALLGFVLGWIPKFLHGPIPEKFNLFYLRGSISVWSWYTARLLVGVM